MRSWYLKTITILPTLDDWKLVATGRQDKAFKSIMSQNWKVFKLGAGGWQETEAADLSMLYSCGIKKEGNKC